jgi:uncharacterized repeat protein (TIGR03803 family)
MSDLVADAAGNLYGTTPKGGKANKGVVFRYGPDGRETLIYAFSGGADGGVPSGPLSVDQDGNLYGTAAQGGAGNFGVVFKIAPNGTETVLHAFAGGPADGAYPAGGVTFGPDNSLYGTAGGGGTANRGVVFALRPKGKLDILHSFAGGPKDGLEPASGVIFDAQGNLYGTTPLGGPGSQDLQPPCCGTVYKISATGHFALLYAFHTDCDGAGPESPPVLDSAGNLYGATPTLGCTDGQNEAWGVIYKVTPSGTETVLHAFTESPDGASPFSTLILGKQGEIYGTTANGGVLDQGTVFEITADGTEEVLHAFQGGRDSQTPYAGLVADPALSGDLYGTTSGLFSRNGTGYGTIFKIRK